MFRELKHILSLSAINSRGWRTRRKIVVIESDDWGSIRMPSQEVYKTLLAQGIAVDKCPFCRYDTLASADDLAALYEVLRSVRDRNGRCAVLTADSVVANPDFDAIRADGFSRYHYEPFTTTLQRYGVGHEKAFTLWQQGMQEGLFRPQFHGREHLNVARWLRALQAEDPMVHLMFDQRHWGVTTRNQMGENEYYLVEFEGEKPEDIDTYPAIIHDGLALFEQIFGYRSHSFVASCYSWGKEVEMALKQEGVRYIQTSCGQRPFLAYKERSIRHYTGEVNAYGQRYGVRNCTFEPASNKNKHWVEACLQEINNAFLWHKPAIICSHRLNFVGSLVERNRTDNLFLFKQLLREIVKRYPDVEFMSSDELNTLMSHQTTK